MGEKETIPELPPMESDGALTRFTKEVRSGRYVAPKPPPPPTRAPTAPPKPSPDVIPPGEYLGESADFPPYVRPGESYGDYEARQKRPEPHPDFPSDERLPPPGVNKEPITQKNPTLPKPKNKTSNSGASKSGLFGISYLTWGLGALNVVLGGIVYYYMVKNPSASIIGDAHSAKKYIFDNMLSLFKSDPKYEKFTTIRTTPACEPGHALKGKQKTTSTIRIQGKDGKIVEKVY